MESKTQHSAFERARVRARRIIFFPKTVTFCKGLEKSKTAALQTTDVKMEICDCYQFLLLT